MPATLEMSPETTHEQIEAYVSEAVKNVEADREGEDDVKGDAQKIAEDRDKPVTEREPGEPEEVTEASESKAKAQDWLDDALKAEVAAYGIEESDLADFTSREELDRALRLFDRKVLEESRKGAPARDDKGRFAPDAPKGETPSETPAEKRDGRYEITLSKDLYDEGLVDELVRLRDHYESRLGVLETRFAESDAMVKQQQFDAAVEAMGHADLFGKTGNESAKELQRRQELFEECESFARSLQERGRQTGAYESLVLRVAKVVFAEHLEKKLWKDKTRQLSKQSQGRMGGSPTRGQDPVEPLRDEMRRLYKEMEAS